MDFYHKLTKFRPSLNEFELNILEFMLAQDGQIEKLTVRDIATEMFTSPNTIMRLCKKLHFSGYREFQESLIGAGKEHSSLVELTSLDEKIIKTKQLINNQIIEEIIDLVHQSNKILFFAVGLSRLPAEDLSERFKILGKNTDIFVDPHVMKHNAKLLTPNDLAIAISISGTTKNILTATTIATAKGAKTISLTGFSTNPLSQLTTHQLYGYVSPTKVFGIDASDRFSMYYLVNVIYSEYIKKYFSHMIN